MSANLLGTVIAIATAFLMLSLRQLILSIGKPRTRPHPNTLDTTGRAQIRIVKPREPVVAEAAGAAPVEPASEIQVQEFLSELRAKAVTAQEQQKNLSDTPLMTPPH